MIPMELKEVSANRPDANLAFKTVKDIVQVPPSAARFWTALGSQLNIPQKVSIAPMELDPRLPGPSKFLGRLAVRVDDKLILVRLADVLWIQSRGNLLRLHVPEAGYDCRMTMKDLQMQLDPDRFLRVHRNAIVNLDYVVDFQLPRYGNAFVHLRNGKALPISRTGRLVLRQTLLARNSAAAGVG